MFGFHFRKTYGCTQCSRWFRSFWRYSHHVHDHNDWPMTPLAEGDTNVQ